MGVEQARISAIEEADLAEVASFLERQRRPGETIMPDPPPPEQRLRWLLLENPARSDDIPLGWCIRDDAQRIVGTLVAVPLRIGCRSFSSVALMSCKFFVDEPHRGLGLGLFMRYLKEGRRFPLLATSANAASGAIFSQFGGYTIDGMDHTMLGVARAAPLAEEWLHRRTGRAAVARLLSIPARLLPNRLARRRHTNGFELRPLADPADGGLDLPTSIDALAVIRDAAYLRWRYQGTGMRARAFHFRGGGDRLVLTELVRSGHRGQICVLNVLDLWPPLTPDVAPALTSLLVEQYAGEFDAIWLRSQSIGEVALRNAGFISHRFPAPLGWCIDPSNLLPVRQWYLMPGESE